MLKLIINPRLLENTESRNKLHNRSLSTDYDIVTEGFIFRCEDLEIKETIELNLNFYLESSFSACTRKIKRLTGIDVAFSYVIDFDSKLIDLEIIEVKRI